MNWKMAGAGTFRWSSVRGDPFCTFFLSQKICVEEFGTAVLGSWSTRGISKHDAGFSNRLTVEGIDGNYARGEHFVEDAGRGRFEDQRRRSTFNTFGGGKAGRAPNNSTSRKVDRRSDSRRIDHVALAARQLLHGGYGQRLAIR